MKNKVIPYYIIAVFFFFMLFIGQFVYRSTLSDTHLVTEDYYNQEINFQNRIEEAKNAIEIEKDFSFSIDKPLLIINFPNGWKKISGEAYLYNPTDSNQDLLLPFNTKKNILRLNISELNSGFWTLKIRFNHNEIPYYIERKIYL